MSVYIVTGNLGSGKSLFVASQIVDYVESGRRVACNFPLNISSLDYKVKYNTTINILPTLPTSEMLWNLGVGGESEEKAGLLVLDEGALIFNSRTWNDKDRQKIVEFLINSRKLKWDVYIIIQHLAALDKQIREMIGELIIRCIRLDRIKIPLLKMAMPRIHVAIARYGTTPSSIVSERWVYRGNKKIYSLYDTATVFRNIEDLKNNDPYELNIHKYVYSYRDRTINYFSNNSLAYLGLLFTSFFGFCKILGSI